jgi:hypothetical protein
MTTKAKITQDALSAYKRAIELHNAPLSADPIARQIHQHAYYQDCEGLRVALDRGRHRVDILDTIGLDRPPHFIISRGPAFCG